MSRIKAKRRRKAFVPLWSLPFSCATFPSNVIVPPASFHSHSPSAERGLDLIGAEGGTEFQRHEFVPSYVKIASSKCSSRKFGGDCIRGADSSAAQLDTLATQPPGLL